MVSVAGFLVDSAAAGGSIIFECIERFLVFCCVFRTGFRRCFFVMVSVVVGKCLWFPSLVFVWFPSWQGNLFHGFRRWFSFSWFPAATGPRLSLQWKP